MKVTIEWTNDDLRAIQQEMKEKWNVAITMKNVERMLNMVVELIEGKETKDDNR